MLYRSFASSSFKRFWNYWNPIWGYYLGYLVFQPLKKRLPDAIALVVTFGISGAVHDLAVSLFLWRSTFIFTPWFTLMGAMVVVSTAFHLCYESRYWITRAALNLAQLAGSFLLVRWIIAY
jgi:hypothetical protein